MNKKKYFDIIPAIDIKNKKCVRLQQGDFNKETIYSDNPIEMARHWEKCGFKRLHLVDLDGAYTGKSINFDLIKEIVRETRLICQIGGGIRDKETIIDYLNIGVSRIILGTKVINQIHFLNELKPIIEMNRVLIGIDAMQDKIAVQGWTAITEINIFNFIKELRTYHISTIVYTDILKDGMLTGPNLQILAELSDQFPEMNFILSGGISSLKDIKTVQKLKRKNISGIIIGKALYDKRISPSELQPFM